MTYLIKSFYDINTNFEDIKKTHEKNAIFYVHQTHSNICYELSPIDDPEHVKNIQADAMIAHNQKCILCIKTADCLPILIFSKKLNCIAAIHAGWRGVLSEIVSICLKKLTLTYKNLDSFEMHIGPHLQRDSFEVDSDVFTKFETLSKKISLTEFYFKQGNKYYIDLSKFVFQQALISGFNEKLIFVSSTDTKTNEQYHSYRRNKGASGRNLSCIGLID